MIAGQGPDAFYRGPIARTVAEASRANGGVLSEGDFGDYSVTEGRPLSCAYRGYEILSAPPPSSGGVTLCQIFAILEGYDMKALGFHSARSVHLMAEAMRRAYLDRNAYLGDPATVSMPLDRLLSKDYAALIRLHINPEKATPTSQLGPAAAGASEHPQTTHFSVTDSEGGAVSVTFTINGFFGANVIAPGTGFFLNDEMDDFAVKPGTPNMFGLIQGEANAIAPGKRPLSSMAPTIVLKDGRPTLVIGSPGGSRIITIVLETIMNVVDYGMEPQEAADAPRFHHQAWPDQIEYEPFGLSPDTMEILTRMGHKLVQRRKWGAAEFIELGAGGADGRAGPARGNDEAMSGTVLPGFFYGASDSRRPAGGAAGF
jgi:gamma-glutamyltranspeptidase / glutathione hydrolase